MKKLSLWGLLAFLFAFSSCTDSKKTDTSTSTTVSTAEKNSAQYKEIYRAIETGDMSKIDFLADDVIDHEGGPTGQPITGSANVKAMLSDMHNHFKDLKFELISDATSADGEYAFALVKMSGTTIDDKMGMPANTVMNHTAVDVVRMRDGKAAEHWGYYNMHEMKNMMPGGSMDKMDSKMDTTKK